MIKIASGISFPGGSTIAHINLCNLFNAQGYRTVFYGPHTWHLDKCPSGNLSQLAFQPDDIVLVHNVKLGPRGARFKKVPEIIGSYFYNARRHEHVP